jgi:hypothetical protein
MYPEFTMSFAKAIDWPAFLADDFAVWSAAFSWDWKVSDSWTSETERF